MSLPNPRKGFGVNKFQELMKSCNIHLNSYDSDSSLSAALATATAYLEYQAKQGMDTKELTALFHKNAGKQETTSGIAGNKVISKKAIAASLPANPESFFFSRFSLRNYSATPISEELLKRIGLIASKTPSVCNRQTAKSYFYTDEESIKRILSLQDGNSGFGHHAKAIAVVTSELACFYKGAERNQGYVDGGLYAMSIVYAAHAVGLGSCMLNWSQGVRTDKKLHELTGIPESEIVITLIAFGHIPEETVIAASPRRDISETCKINQPLEEDKA
ncbi:Nitroreductase [Halopseudomonas sabulinigri]|uniref:Nitroreductase n=1 Tax=Halopseudomonas sabulinigri TaxID=472181 RepID=A0A1H1L9X2_9GAMM|nr:nitroreductase family protein [Halopseudomonas sabulinigri]SDR70815.1 Nitroreductase [Halopseudomonas sabulinigri]